MIDKSEKLMSLQEAARYVNGRFCRGEKKLHVSTLFRWASRGVKGRKLETVSIGSLKATSEEALNRFFSPVAEQPTTCPPAGPPPPGGPVSAGSTLSTSSRDRRAREAERLLTEAGV